MPDLADHAYAHCVAVLIGSDAAASCATAALRRGGRGRSTVLAFARHIALDADAEPPIPDFEPADLGELALGLASTRTPSSRAVADLHLRHDLDRAGLGRALSLAPADAAALAATVVEDWAHDLDPALLAWFGPGDCDELRDLLAENGLWLMPDADDPDTEDKESRGSPPEGRTIVQLLGVAPAVGVHAEQCEVCADRRRAMVSVHSLVGQRPLERAPESVRAAARRSPFRVGTLPGPSPLHAAAVGRTQPRRRPSRRTTRLATGGAGVVVVALAAFGITKAAGQPSGADKRNNRVAALTKIAPAGSALTITPPEVRPAAGAMLLRNTSKATVRWKVTTGVAWLEVSPATGELPPGGATELDTRILASAPEGDQRIPVTVEGDDGSTAGALVDSTVEHQPTLAAGIAGCIVTATAVDEGDVRSVFVHWRTKLEPGDHLLQMVAAGPPDTYFGTLPAGEEPTSWWATAVDGRGNRAQSVEVALTPGSC